jgi:mannose-6-phosphate isomerase-like protein (cupin superfamily)
MDALRPYRSDAVTLAVAQRPLTPESAALHLVEWEAAGGGQTPPMLVAPVHVHWDDDETWYVLQGRLSVLLHDTVVTVPAGGAVTALAGTRHTYWNPDSTPCRYVLVMPPRIHALITALHAGVGREMSEVFLNHRSELLGGWALPDDITVPLV